MAPKHWKGQSRGLLSAVVENVCGGYQGKVELGKQGPMKNTLKNKHAFPHQTFNPQGENTEEENRGLQTVS